MALTPEQTQELRATLEQRRAALMTEVSQDLSRLRQDRTETLVGAVPDPGDESVASLIADLDQADASRDIAELQMLESARQRMADGSYGICINCGLEIGFERLRANPGAERCINCQTMFEKTHAQNTGSKL
jgi:RNA polymerase-binding protein DksA